MNPKFCCRSCSMIVNNKLYKKRSLKNRCVDCQKKIHSQRKRCHSCHTLLRRSSINTPLSQLNMAWSHICSSIRSHARKIIQELDFQQECSVCGYNLHTQVCHIKPIRMFSKTSTISEINSLSNLALLCPNHHWEFDHGIIESVPNLKNIPARIQT